ncbi:hypothetical protein IP78_06810 [Brevundimonas sp. AAP58]|nr:hypothetical protein IP78_06810 [Brevundimonas sp. AAP58]
MEHELSGVQIEAAARQLYRIGRHHHWFSGPPDYREMDAIAVSEFEGLVEEILRAAGNARPA